MYYKKRNMSKAFIQEKLGEMILGLLLSEQNIQRAQPAVALACGHLGMDQITGLLF